MHHRAKDITGLCVGYLTVTRYHGSDGKKSLWEARCRCGNISIQAASDLQKWAKRGALTSCGCSRRASIGKQNFKHGMSHHPAYSVWRAMLDRCRLPSHHAYKNYGARGISVCESWQESFDNFWTVMGLSYQRGSTLERLDNSGGYTPENCAWRSRRAQCNNRRANRVLETPAGRMTLSEAAQHYGIGRSTLDYRLAQGWLLADALSVKPDVRNRMSTTLSTAVPATDSSSEGSTGCL